MFSKYEFITLPFHSDYQDGHKNNFTTIYALIHWEKDKENNDNICMQIDDNADSWLTCMACCILIRLKQYGIMVYMVYKA